MSLVHTNGKAAKQLKEISDWTPKKLRRYYIKTVMIMKKMYKSCKLVHADLSEYNLLVNKQELFVIDVGQAVDIAHPKAHDYLKRDIKVISSFFEKNCRKTNISIGQLNQTMLYDFILYEDREDDNKPAVEAEAEWLVSMAAKENDYSKLLKTIMESNL